MDRNKYLVILSGGQDSTTCLYWALNQANADVHAVSFNYGQKHLRELESAIKIAAMAGIANKHEVINVEGILHSTSPLMAHVAEAPRQVDRTASTGERESTFVPMRNALFLTIAANRAAEIGAGHIVIGVSQEDTAGYSDCRATFIHATEDYINLALGIEGRRLQVTAPLLFLQKAKAIHLAMRLPGCMNALAYSHTCYAGKYPPTDRNHANVLREEAFCDAGVADPLVVRAWQEGLMDLPATKNYDQLRDKQ